MKLLSIFRKKIKKVSPDTSTEKGDTSHDESDVSSYINDVSEQVNQSDVVKEDPLITISRQLTQLQYQVAEVKPAIESGVQSLREDHYRILEEQVNGVDEYKRFIDEKRKELLNTKESAEKELENLEIDSRILDLLGESRKRTIEIADALKITRQYASDRMKKLLELGQIESVKEGRRVFYTSKVEDNTQISMPTADSQQVTAE